MFASNLGCSMIGYYLSEIVNEYYHLCSNTRKAKWIEYQKTTTYAVVRSQVRNERYHLCSSS